MADLDRSTELVHLIGGRMVNDEAYLALDWAAIALAVTITESMASMSGFAYLDDGKVVPEYPADRDITNLFEALREATARPDGKNWVAALIQITRATGHARFLYEWDDPDRWKVTPVNLEAMRESMRPDPETAG